MIRKRRNFISAATIVAAVVGCAHDGAAQMLFPTPDTEELKLKGSVREMAEYYITKNEYFSVDELEEYKRKGVKPPTTERDLDTRYQFDRRGFTLSKLQDFLGNEYVWTSSYDADGRRVSERMYKNGELSTLYTFDYDSKGMPSDARKVDADGKVIFTETNDVERKGDFIVQTNIHTSADGITTVCVIEYLPNGRMKRFSDSTGSNYMISTFDDDGNPLTYETRRDGESRKMRMTKKSSSPDINLIYCIEGSGGEYLFSETVNDEKGNPVSRTEYNPDGSVRSQETWKYVYDDYGNWIRKTRVNDAENKSYLYKEREFTYY